MKLAWQGDVLMEANIQGSQKCSGGSGLQTGVRAQHQQPNTTEGCLWAGLTPDPLHSPGAGAGSPYGEEQGTARLSAGRAHTAGRWVVGWDLHQALL